MSMNFRGVWEHDQVYEKGDAVVYVGSVWMCHGITRATPGKSALWKLMVRKGRDDPDSKM